jgi:hypothetical protein
MASKKTLVIILSETRAHELTFDSFKKNVIDELNADLCLCIGIKPDYDYDNPFYKLAKFRFLHNEPDDFATSFDYAYHIISVDKYNNNINPEYDENKHLHWREFLKLKDQFLGGIKDEYDQHPGSAGILIFFRWFLLQNLMENNLIDKYDKFIITRSDYIYQLPHPKVENMSDDNIWIPDGEHYGGYTDRHVVLSRKNIKEYLNILDNIVLRSNEYYNKMKGVSDWNLERLIKFHLAQNNVIHSVKEFPYIMYAVRNINGSTRWSQGVYSAKFNYYIKYMSEYNKSNYYKNKFEDLKHRENTDIDEFYKYLYTTR